MLCSHLVVFTRLSLKAYSHLQSDFISLKYAITLGIMGVLTLGTLPILKMKGLQRFFSAVPLSESFSYPSNVSLLYEMGMIYSLNSK